MRLKEGRQNINRPESLTDPYSRLLPTQRRHPASRTARPIRERRKPDSWQRQRPLVPGQGAGSQPGSARLWPFRHWMPLQRPLRRPPQQHVRPCQAAHQRAAPRSVLQSFSSDMLSCWPTLMQQSGPNWRPKQLPDVQKKGLLLRGRGKKRQRKRQRSRRRHWQRLRRRPGITLPVWRLVCWSSKRRSKERSGQRRQRRRRLQLLGSALRLCGEFPAALLAASSCPHWPLLLKTM